MTIVRTWRATIDPSRADEYQGFARTWSLPIFDAQPGCQGVLFSRRGDEVLVISFWRDEPAVRALDTSPSYQRTVRAIEESGLVVGETRLEVFTLHGGSAEWTATLDESPG